MAQNWTYEPASKQFTHTAYFVFLLLWSYLLVYFNCKTYCWICLLEEGKKRLHRELLLQFLRPHGLTVSKGLFFTRVKCPTSFPQDRAILLSPGGLKSRRMLSRTYFDSVHPHCNKGQIPTVLSRLSLILSLLSDSKSLTVFFKIRTLYFHCCVRSSHVWSSYCKSLYLPQE